MLATENLPTNICRGRQSDEVNADVQATAQRFRERFEGDKASVEVRKAEAQKMTNEYYDMVTDFYEYGWGQAFHFAPAFANEGFHESLCRHEYFLAARGGFGPKMRVLDIGCGVGGPLRNIARFSQAECIGVNNNLYQIGRGNRYNKKAGLSHLCSFVHTDFMRLPFKDCEVDGAYAIEATCHAPDKVGCFKEIFRSLKPGSHFVGYEWVMTPKYDPKNETHRKIKLGIELGDSLPDLETGDQVIAALKAAGFEVVEAFDMCEYFENSEMATRPWYHPLEGSFTLSGFKSTTLGRWCTSKMVSWLEFFRIAAKGSTATAAILEEAAVNLVAGGRLKIFTPCFYFKVRKPTK